MIELIGTLLLVYLLVKCVSRQGANETMFGPKHNPMDDL